MNTNTDSERIRREVGLAIFGNEGLDGGWAHAPMAVRENHIAAADRVLRVLELLGVLNPPPESTVRALEYRLGWWEQSFALKVRNLPRHGSPLVGYRWLLVSDDEYREPYQQ